MDGDVPNVLSALSALPVASHVTGSDEVVDVLVPEAESALPLVLREAASAGATVRSVVVQEPDLETVFLHLTGKRLRD